MINGHTQGSFLDDKKYWAFFDAPRPITCRCTLHPREPHPSVMQAYFDGYREISLAAWGFAIDTGAHFLRLVFAGVFNRFPGFRIWILGHLVKALPWSGMPQRQTHRGRRRG